MRNKKILAASVAILVIMMCLMIGCEKKPSDSETKTINIGYLAALTGFGSDSERLTWEGAQIAEAYLNKQGGITINGEKYLINCEVEDTKGSADGSVAAAQRLIHDKNINIIVGQAVPFETIATNTVTEPAKALHVMMYNTMTPAEFGPDTPYSFLCEGGAFEYGTAIVSYVTKQKPDMKRVVLILPDDGSMPYAQPKLTKMMQGLGLEIIDVVGWAQDTVDFTPIALKAIAKNPDGIAIISGWPAAMGAMLKGVRENGYTGIVMTTNPAQDVLTVAGPAASTNYYSTGIYPDSPMMTSIVKELKPMFEEKFGHALYYNFWGLDPVYVTVKVIEAAQSLDPTVIRDYWEKADTVETIFGTAAMGGLETYGIRHSVCTPLGIQSLMNGQGEFLAWQKIVSP